MKWSGNVYISMQVGVAVIGVWTFGECPFGKTCGAQKVISHVIYLGRGLDRGPKSFTSTQFLKLTSFTELKLTFFVLFLSFASTTIALRNVIDLGIS